jgi:5-methyltetrahydrofolate--homocysteine methyltransferase
MPSIGTHALLLDGGMGTALAERGLPPHAVPETWLADRPHAVAAVHAAHVAAGAEVVLTCTFNLASPRAAEIALRAGVGALAREAVACARRAGAPRVAGAVGPTGLARPGAPRAERAELAAWYRSAFDALAAAGADLLWAEGQCDLEEARAALDAARATGLPCAVTFTPTDPACASLPCGGDLQAALVGAADAGACAVGVNCAFATPALEDLVARLAPRVAVPLVAKPSPGLPGSLLPPAALGARARALVDAGARWVGGCCGASEAHLAAIAAAVRGAR